MAVSHFPGGKVMPMITWTGLLSFCLGGLCSYLRWLSGLEYSGPQGLRRGKRCGRATAATRLIRWACMFSSLRGTTDSVRGGS